MKHIVLTSSIHKFHEKLFGFGLSINFLVTILLNVNFIYFVYKNVLLLHHPHNKNVFIFTE